MSSLVLSVNDNHWTVGWNFASGFPCSYYLKCFKAACLVKSLVKVLKPLIIGKVYFLKPPIIGKVYVYISADFKNPRILILTKPKINKSYYNHRNVVERKEGKSGKISLKISKKYKIFLFCYFVAKLNFFKKSFIFGKNLVTLQLVSIFCSKRKKFNIIHKHTPPGRAKLKNFSAKMQQK